MFDPIDKLEPAIEMLDERGAALDPIAVIAIKHTVHLANLGVMDVAADDTINTTTVRLGGHRIRERADVLHCVFHPVLEIGGKRPVLISQATPHYIEIAVEPKCSGVCAIAEQRQ